MLTAPAGPRPAGLRPPVSRRAGAPATIEDRTRLAVGIERRRRSVGIERRRRAGGIERRQRRAGGTLVVALAATVADALVTGSGAVWLGALVLAVAAAGYLAAAARIRRLAADREMAAAFAAARPDLDALDWRALDWGPSDLIFPGEEAAAEVAPPAVQGLDRELMLFLGAWILGLLLTPVVALIRLAGGAQSGSGRSGVIASVVRAQAYGRSKSLKMVAAGVFATAGVTTVAVGAGGSAYGTALVAAPAAIHGTALSGVTGVGRRKAVLLPRLGSRVMNGPALINPEKLLKKLAAAGYKESARAATALRVALAQVGKPYVYGAAGPSAFDCSGLMRFAWGAAGVLLPHNSAAQYDSTTHIAGTQLRPGDLVYYNGFGHVAMYIGAQEVVSANSPGSNVQTQSISWDGVVDGYSRVG